MERWKRVATALLFPPIGMMLVLLILATALLVYALVSMEAQSGAAIGAYVLAFYTLTVWCLRLPGLVREAKSFWNHNPYARRWREDVQLRVRVSLFASLLWNGAYSVFQLCLGLFHRSFWFYSMAAYYFLLALMRMILAQHTSKFRPGEKRIAELRRYRACGWIFLGMNTALALMIFFMVYWDRTFHHHEITTIAMAAYTFTSFAVAITNLVRYRKYRSPVYSASKAISLAAACVSMLTLESTMLTTFGGEAMEISTRRLFLGLTGGAISAFIIAMAIFMIARANKEIHNG